MARAKVHVARWDQGKRNFPTLAVILLAVGVIWLLNELKVFDFELPWWPIILIIIALGMIYNRFKK